MCVKIYLVSIYAVLSLDLVVKGTRIPTAKCMQRGWELCNIRQIDITPAERLHDDNSCFVDQGSNVTVSFNFTPRFETYNLKWAIWVETMIGDYKVPGVPDDARNFSNYPTIENKFNPFETVLHIPNDIRVKKWVVRATITGDSDRDICCFLCEIRVREPVDTTAVTSTSFDPTNPYDIIRQHVSFPSIWDFNELMKKFQNNSEVFDKFILDNTSTTPKPSYWAVVKNFFMGLFGFKSEEMVTPKVPFLGNVSSLMEYFSVASIESQTTSIVDETSVNIKPEVDEKITSAASSSVTESESESSKNSIENEANPDKQDVRDDELDKENNLDTEETATTTVETTRHKMAVRTTRQMGSKLNTTRKRGSGPMKVARAGIRKVVRSVSKSTTTS